MEKPRYGSDVTRQEYEEIKPLLEKKRGKNGVSCGEGCGR